jgi:thiamine biosynthesis lipoprotein
MWGVVFLASLAGCANNAAEKRPAAQTSQKLERFEYAQVHMGVVTRLVVYAKDEQTAVEACTAAYRRVAELEQIFTDYRKSSELMQLCGKAGGEPVKVSDELFDVLKMASQVAKDSGAAFDVTVGPFVQLWREARRSGRMPAASELEKARGLVGWEKVELDEKAKTVKLAVAGMRLDLGGIGKGYAGDEALRVLARFGIKSALFEAGGDIVMGHGPPDAKGWVIEVASDRESGEGKVLTVANCAVSTSGDTSQHVVIDGRRYSHIVDPRTGVGMTNRNYVTVVAKDGVTSDPLSTAACVLGEEGTKSLLEKYPATKAYFAPPVR